MGLGIAAGAFMRNYAAAKGLKSKLDAEEQQRELTDIEIKRKRDFDSAQKELATMHQQFLDPNYDFVGNKPYEAQQNGIAGPGQQRPTDPYTDSARVKAYYDRIAPVLERQAFASGKDFLGVRTQINDLRKNQFIEKVGSALSMIEAGDEAGIKNLQAVYDMYPDGRRITGGKINEDGTVLLQYEKDGKADERVISREQLINYGKLALNPADAAKLRFQLLENEKERAFKTGERVAGQEFQTGERVAGQEFKTGERVAGEKFQTGERVAGQEYQTSETGRKLKQAKEEGAADRGSRERISAAENVSRERVAQLNRDAEAATRAAKISEAEAAAETRKQKYFNNYFQVDEKFAPKPESEVKNLFGSAKEAYQRDLARWQASTRMSRFAANLASTNEKISNARLARIAQQVNDGALEIMRENDGDKRRFVIDGKDRIYID